MNLKENQLYKNFEKEIWLYLDNELPEERQDYWDEQIKQNQKLQNYLNDYLSISKDYELSSQIDIDEKTFDLMISNAVSKKSIFQKVKQFVLELFSTDVEFSFGKIAFASFLIVGAVVFSIISNKSNPVDNLTKVINTQLLEWNPDYFESRVNKIENMLKLTKDDEYRKYYLYGVSPKNVDKNINLIGNNVNELKKEIKTKDL